MNDLYYNIIIIVLVLVLFLAYILIAYFYSSYNNYKEDVDDNFEKTKNYINTTISKLDNNIRSSVTENNTKIISTSNYISDINNRVNRVDLKFKDNYDELNLSLKNTNINLNNANSNLNNANSNLNNANIKLTSNDININKFDTNLKQFFQYKSNGTTINDAIYNYQFGATPNISLDLLRNVNAISGITVETDNSSINNNFRLCDKTKNCMDMNIDNKGLNIFPTSSSFNSNNTTSNIYIHDTNKKILAKFDLQNRGIYLGGDAEDAGIYIKDSNVYIKKLNYINGNFNDTKVIYDKTKIGQIQNYNTYPYDYNDINNTTIITGIYTIIRSSATIPNILIINFKSSNDIQIGTSITFNIPELFNINTSDQSIATGVESSIINTPILNVQNIKITTSSIIYKNINIRIKITNGLIRIDSTNFPDTETIITNTFNFHL
jgi:hypothetical protein